jgi:hypothetical protein
VKGAHEKYKFAFNVGGDANRASLALFDKTGYLDASTKITGPAGEAMTLAQLERLVGADSDLNFEADYDDRGASSKITALRVVRSFGRRSVTVDKAAESVSDSSKRIVSDGLSFEVLATTVIKDAEGRAITLAQLEALIAANALLRAETVLSIQGIRYDDGRYEALSVTVKTPTPTHARLFRGAVSAVDGTNRRLTVNGTTYQVAADFGAATPTNLLLTFGEFAEYVAARRSQGIDVLASFEMAEVGAGVWQIKKASLLKTQETGLPSRAPAQSVKGVVTIDLATDAVTVGGIALSLPAGVTIVDSTGAEITYADFERLYSKNLANSLPTYADVTLTEAGDWTAKRIRLTTSFFEKIAGKVGAVDVAAKTVGVRGESFDLSGAALRYDDGRPLTLAELWNLTNDDPNKQVTGFETDPNNALASITVNGTRYTVAAGAQFVDAQGHTVPSQSFALLLQGALQAGLQSYVQVTASDGVATKIELKQKKTNVYVEVAAEKVGAAWIAKEAVVKFGVEPVAPATTNYWRETKAFATVGNTRVVLDGTTTLTDARDPFNRVPLSLTTLARIVADSPALDFVVKAPKDGESPALSGTLTFGGPAEVDSATRAAIMDQI